MPEKYQEEIEQLLEGIEREAPDDMPRSNAARASRGAPSFIGTDEQNPPIDTKVNSLRRISLSPGKLALAGLSLFLVAALFSWTPLIWVGLVILVGAYLLFFVKPRPTNDQKIWRGRVMEETPSWSDRVKRWLKN